MSDVATVKFNETLSLHGFEVSLQTLQQTAAEGTWSNQALLDLHLHLISHLDLFFSSTSLISREEVPVTEGFESCIEALSLRRVKH